MPTVKQIEASKRIMENHGNISKTMLEVGYTAASAKNPKNLTESDGWKQLMGKYLSDEELSQKHRELLDSTYVDHAVFPLKVTDEEITELLAEVNCKTRKFMHSDTQTHVWFWSADNKARKDALDMAYKLKGKYAPDKSVVVTIEADADAVVEEITEKLNALYKGTSQPSDGEITSALGTEVQNQE